MAFEKLLRRLADKELLTPYLDAAMLADTWPDSYTITVDSGPYYGAGDGYFHPSTHPLMTPRQLYYLFHPDHKHQMVPERRTVTSHWYLAMGTALHSVIQTQMQMIGLIKDPDDVEVEYVNDLHRVRGRVDMIIDHPNGQRIPVEFKTAHTRVFEALDGLKPEWEAQLSLGLDGTGYDEGILLVLERGGTFQMREFHMRKNQPLLNEIYDKFDRVRDCIARNDPPRGCCGGWGSPEVQKCPARFVCWPGGFS